MPTRRGTDLIDGNKIRFFDEKELRRATTQEQANQAETKAEQAAMPKDGAVDMTNLHQRMGRVIQVREFKRLLHRLNPNLIFILSKGDPTKYGVYMPSYGLVHNKLTQNEPRFICGMESGVNFGGRIDEGVMPEFSIAVNEDIIIPDGDSIKKSKKFVKELRGWRTVLAALYAEGLLTEAQIETTFKISQGRGSANWKRRVHPGIQTTVAGSN